MSSQIFFNNKEIIQILKCQMMQENSSYNKTKTIVSGAEVTVILPVVLYGCETWSLTSREEHRLRVFENRVLRRIFGPKRDETTRGWRKLHNEELDNLFFSPSIIRMIKSRRLIWAGHVARMGAKRTACRILVAKREGKRKGGISRSRWVDNIKIYLREIRMGGTNWIDLAQDRDLCRAPKNTVMNLRVP
jgi:hypothetical protein